MLSANRWKDLRVIGTKRPWLSEREQPEDEQPVAPPLTTHLIAVTAQGTRLMARVCN
jgi:hypothetical protein